MFLVIVTSCIRFVALETVYYQLPDYNITEVYLEQRKDYHGDMTSICSDYRTIDFYCERALKMVNELGTNIFKSDSEFHYVVQTSMWPEKNKRTGCAYNKYVPLRDMRYKQTALICAYQMEDLEGVKKLKGSSSASNAQIGYLILSKGPMKDKGCYVFYRNSREEGIPYIHLHSYCCVKKHRKKNSGRNKEKK